MPEARAIRVTFEKGERVKYISHLDMNRAFQRAIKRSRVPAVYTQGFNPHVDLVFSPPLSVGYLSEGEIADFKVTGDITDEEIRERLNKSLPDGLQTKTVKSAVKKISDIAFASYEVIIEGEVDFSVFHGLDEVLILKKSKKGEKMVDIKQYLTSLVTETREGNTIFKTLLPCNNDAINPALLVKAVNEHFQKELIFKVKRLGFFDAEKNPFC